MTADSDDPVDWRHRVSTAGLVIGSALMGLERALFPDKQKDRTEQVAEDPGEPWPRLRFDRSDLDPLGPDDDGYWPA